ncbi:MAG: sigma-70 family RNA polymerase sigma factor [Mariniblastus sp.]
MNKNSTLGFGGQTFFTARNISDQRSWDEFIRRYTPRVFSWCKNHSLSDPQASVLTQQVLVQLVEVMRKTDFVPRRSNFRVWVKKVITRAMNALFGDQQSSEIRPEFFPLLGDNAIAALTDQFETAYEEELLQVAESKARSRLPANIWNVYFEITSHQKSAAQVANQFGTTVAEVYIAKNKVIKVLRDIIRQLENSSHDNKLPS